MDLPKTKQQWLQLGDLYNDMDEAGYEGIADAINSELQHIEQMVGDDVVCQWLGTKSPDDPLNIVITEQGQNYDTDNNS